MTRAQQGSWKKYCSEPLDKIEHYEEALAENFKGWCIHHRLEIKSDGTRVSAKELIDNGLYFHRPASELVFMREHDHRSMHTAGANHHLFGKHQSAETRRKLSEAHKGKHLSAETRLKISESMKGENNYWFGKHHSAEARKKMSEVHKGKHRSAETRRKMSEARKGKPTCIKGKHWYNNGVKNILAKTCPEGFVPGRLK